MSKSKICSQTFLLGINRYKVFMKMLKKPDIMRSEAQENSVLLDFQAYSEKKCQIRPINENLT